MTRANVELSPDEELLILKLWVYGTDIRRTFREEQLEAVPGLREIVEAVSHLPDAIGWGDEPPPNDDVGRSGL